MVSSKLVKYLCRQGQLLSSIRLCSSSNTSLKSQLIQRIKLTGPITVADYMHTVLIQPSFGYYMKKDVLGPSGDFVTSPEISQLFGEMVGIWCVNELQQISAKLISTPTKLQLVELGPGKGTLLFDILKVFTKFLNVRNRLSCIRLFEVSPQMREEQKKSLGVSENHYSDLLGSVPVRWHVDLDELNQLDHDIQTIFIAHEFFDALPIHKFQWTEESQAWREILIDVSVCGEQLRYTLAPRETVAQILLTKDLEIARNKGMNHVEISPHAGKIIQQLSSFIGNGGHSMAIITDYGNTGNTLTGDTFRAFRQHKQCNPLDEPGTADLTADVDFEFLSRCVSDLPEIKDKVALFGPICQRDFLQNMGIALRLKMLLANCKSPEIARNLLAGYDMLTSRTQMGARFKFLFALPQTTCPEDYIPAGFAPLS